MKFRRHVLMNDTAIRWHKYFYGLSPEKRVLARLLDYEIIFPFDATGMTDGNGEWLFPMSCLLSELPSWRKRAKAFNVDLDEIGRREESYHGD